MNLTLSHPHRSRKSVPDSYSDQLISEGLMTEAERDEIKSKYYATLNDKLSNMTLYSPPPTNLQGRWGDLVEPQARVSTWDTGVSVPLLQFVGAKSVDIPEQIQLHSHLGKTHVQVRPSPLSFLLHHLLLTWQQLEYDFSSFVNSGSIEQAGRGDQTGLVHSRGLGFWLSPLPRSVLSRKYIRSGLRITEFY